MYTFRKRDGIWIVTCPSDMSIKRTKYTSFINAINAFLATFKSVEHFDIVIPLSKSTPINITKPIQFHKRKYNRAVKYIIKNLYNDTHPPLDID
jgi:hypothetical protein